MQLTMRDKALLYLLCRHNLLSTKQIQAEVFPRLDLSTVMRRLRKLQQGGFIVRLGMLGCRTWVWACSQLSNELFTGFPSSQRTNLHTLHHDVALSDLRLMMEGITRVDAWYDIRHVRNCVMPEPFYLEYNSRNYNFAKGDAALVPDAMFFGFKNDQPFTCALELELSQIGRAHV